MDSLQCFDECEANLSGLWAAVLREATEYRLLGRAQRVLPGVLPRRAALKLQLPLLKLLSREEVGVLFSERQLVTDQSSDFVDACCGQPRHRVIIDQQGRALVAHAGA